MWHLATCTTAAASCKAAAVDCYKESATWACNTSSRQRYPSLLRAGTCACAALQVQENVSHIVLSIFNAGVLPPLQPRLAQLLALQHAQDLSRRGRTAAWCGTLSQLLQMLRCFVDSVQPPRLGQQGAMHQGQQGPLTAQQCSDGCSGRLCAWPCICC